MTTILLLAICVTSNVYSQTQFGFNTTTPDASAVMEIVDTTRGLLIPRMSTSDRNGIASPATGLLVYDNTENKFYYYNGTAWTGIDNKWSRSGNYVYNNSDSIGIGTATPSYLLDVTDDINLSVEKGLRINGILVLHSRSNGSIFIGGNAGRNITSAGSNTFVGFNAGRNDTTSSYNTLVGAGAGTNVNGLSNSFF